MGNPHQNGWGEQKAWLAWNRCAPTRGSGGQGDAVEMLIIQEEPSMPNAEVCKRNANMELLSLVPSPGCRVRELALNDKGSRS